MFLSYSFYCDKLFSMWKLGFSGYLFTLTPRSRLAGSRTGIVCHSALQKAAPRDISWSICECALAITHSTAPVTTSHTCPPPPPFPWHNKYPHSHWSFLCRMWKVLGTNRTEGCEISFFLLSLSPAMWAQVLTPSLSPKLETEDSLLVKNIQTWLNKWKKQLGVFTTMNRANC